MNSNNLTLVTGIVIKERCCQYQTNHMHMADNIDQRWLHDWHCNQIHERWQNHDRIQQQQGEPQQQQNQGKQNHQETV